MLDTAARAARCPTLARCAERSTPQTHRATHPAHRTHPGNVRGAAYDGAVTTTSATQRSRSWLWAFAPYALISIVHVVTLGMGATDISGPSKIALMPALFLAVAIAVPKPRGTTVALLLAAITASWLGDSAGVFFPALPTLPLMIGFFAIAHLIYIWLFLRHLSVRRVARWSLIYVAWWVILLIVLWPHLGALSIAVAAYGLVLGGTAAASTRANRIVTIGGVLFLVSDTLLAFLLFTPALVPPLTDPTVMLTYTLGQGLIAIGAVVTIRARRAVAAVTESAGTA